MNRLYSTLLAIPLVVACERSGDSVQSIDTKVDAHDQSVASRGDPDDNPCDGPPSIQHLFDAYDLKRKTVDQLGNTDAPMIKRVYTQAEREMQRAREEQSLCEKYEKDDPAAAQFFSSVAKHYAISANNWMTETFARTWELYR